MSLRRVAFALLLAGSAILESADAQEPTRLVIRDGGHAWLGSIMRDVLTRPYTAIVGDSADLIIPHDSVIPRSLIVIGRSVRTAGIVRGDLIVVGGDVFLRPGAEVDGDVVAAGGAVYDSYISDVRGQRLSFRDEAFVATPLSGGDYELSYARLRPSRIRTFSLPGIYGLEIPTYDRVNGLSLPFRPRIELKDGTIIIEPALTYRSNLGKIDPSVFGKYELQRGLRVELEAARTSRTNDAWIIDDFSNSLNTLWNGRDTRNWYRADLLQARLHRQYVMESGEITPYIGGQWENAWSTGILTTAAHTPWSLLDRNDTEEGMARPNPAVLEGDITSAIAGFRGLWDWRPRRVHVRAYGLLEGAPVVVGDNRFTQLTLDARVRFPLVRDIMFRIEGHAVGTLGDAPPQRFAYLGGSGTIKTLDLLSEGGDQLLYFESRAWMPIEKYRVPYLGPPIIMVRHMMGSAGIGSLPGFTHNIALRVALSILMAEVAVDPVHGDTDWTFGVSLIR